MGLQELRSAQTPQTTIREPNEVQWHGKLARRRSTELSEGLKNFPLTGDFEKSHMGRLREKQSVDELLVARPKVSQLFCFVEAVQGPNQKPLAKTPLTQGPEK